MAAAKVLGPRSGSSSSVGSRSGSSLSASSGSSASKPVLSARSETPGGIKSGRSPSPEKAKEKQKKSGKEKDSKKISSPKDVPRGGASKKTAEVNHFANIASSTSYGKLGGLKDCGGDVAVEIELVLKKLSACRTLYDFSRDNEVPEKEGKRLTLLEVLEWLPSDEKADKKKDKEKERDKSKLPKSVKALAELSLSAGSGSIDSSDLKTVKLAKPVIQAVVDLVQANCFRVLQHRERTPMDLLDGEDEEPLLAPNWPHLELVYEILLKILGKELDVNVAQAAGMDKDFLHSLLELFESDDPREREILKTIMIKFFNRLSPLRSTMRRGIQTFCLRAVHSEAEEAPQCGLAEVLDVLSSRIVGAFSTPLRDEHRDVLLKVLLPLYKLNTLLFFYSQLKELVRMFCKKDNQLVKPVIQSLLRYWPVTVCSKQTIFISELEDMVLALPPGEFRSVASPVVKRLAACIAGPSFEVAERALQFWRNQQLIKLTVNYGREEMPLVVSALYGNITQAWMPSVLTKTLEVLKNFMEADNELFDNNSSKHRKEAEEVDKRELLRQKRWAQLQAMHTKQKRASIQARPKQAAQKAVIEPAEGRSALQFEEDLMLKPTASSAVSVCWNYKNETKKQRVVLQALLVSTDGKIIDGVHERNITALQSAARLTSRAPSAAAQMSDCSGTIWASLDLLPSHIALIIYVMSSPEGELLGDIARDTILVLELNGNVALGEIELDMPRDSRLGIIAVSKRVDSSSWSFVPKREYSKTSLHSADLPEILARTVRESLPSLPKRQKPLASFTVMERGSVVDLPATSSQATAKIFIGMGWDFYSPNEIAKIDVALVLMDAEGKHTGTVSNGNPEGIAGAFHTGNGSLSAGVFLELDALPEEVSVIFLVGHIDSSEYTFDCVQQPHTTIIDTGGKEIARYSMSEDDSNLCNGLIMSRIFWNEFHERWNCQALGVYSKGQTWRKSLDVMLPLLHKPPSAFQTLLLEDEDHTVKGTPSTVASGHSMLLSI
mmetsp:Transcript_1270/g.2649  ORF Transcript_1270/g.2649 Transcript_1270/m.2649 type:complete len:1006 (-) Transcript_1270:261-3278(-)